MKKSRDEWWGNYSIEHNLTAQWEIGPLRIAVQRLPREWLIAHEQINTANSDHEWRFTYSDLDLNVGDNSDFSRIVCRKTQEQLTILPALADRSVVSRPITPFTVPVDEDATIYVSTPLWLNLTSGQQLWTLYETAIQRPSDTWFGSSTLEGETCYASRTYARLNLENQSGYLHRAITQVHIHNKTTVPLIIERINLPVPFLSLFYGQDKILWTETVTMVQTSGTSLAELHIQKKPLSSVEGPKLIAGPRQDPQKSILIRAFGALKLQ